MTSLRNLRSLNASVIELDMPRPRSKNPDKNLVRTLRLRLDHATYRRIEELQKNSGCGSLAEVARRMLFAKPITVFQRDVTMNATMEELVSIRRELRLIGVNINQITRHFNQDKEGRHRSYYVMQVADLYKLVGQKVEALMPIIEQLAEKWLRKSSPENP